MNDIGAIGAAGINAVGTIATTKIIADTVTGISGNMHKTKHKGTKVTNQKPSKKVFGKGFGTSGKKSKIKF